ncbi:hypothetical protein PoB_006232900 [Plakobranchus ocellatus]|uniref:Uncharacterized protein n=1 Tax=Plakobranchus ocellatus TaxID=259542 RepID=A0AAV4CV98_9GAST|nr:hypothetical protein PoB_006232900 [Plakobranchus ocellatus]
MNPNIWTMRILKHNPNIRTMRILKAIIPSAHAVFSPQGVQLETSPVGVPCNRLVVVIIETAFSLFSSSYAPDERLMFFTWYVISPAIVLLYP